MSRGLRIQLYVAGDLREEVWVETLEEAAQVAYRQGAVVAATNEPWLVSVYNPDAPEHEAYFRYGTDRSGMVDPLPEVPKDHPAGRWGA